MIRNYLSLENIINFLRVRQLGIWSWKDGKDSTMGFGKAVEEDERCSHFAGFFPFSKAFVSLLTAIVKL